MSVEICRFNLIYINCVFQNKEVFMKRITPISSILLIIFFAFLLIHCGSSDNNNDNNNNDNNNTSGYSEDSPDPIIIQVKLKYWPHGTDKWFLGFRVMVNDATRVYATGDYISGSYELYKCGVEGSKYPKDLWLSTNNPECIIGIGEYNIGEEPTLPFDIVIHVVLPSGEETYPVTITDYETYRE